MKGTMLVFGKQRVVKSITAFVIATILVPFFVFPKKLNAATGDEVRAAKKIISVVYDDSGSMVGERWAYANYSTQALIALMNEQDELYVTFMRDPEVSQPVSLSSLQNSVNMIRDLSETGNTPEKALDTAMARLDSIQEDDPATQFWLIVMTDGEIYDYPSNSIEIDIQGKLNSYKNKVMSNSSELNVVYLGMVGAANVNEDISNHLYSFMPNDDYGIVSTMQDISNLVSSRIAADDIKRVDSHTIQVTSKLPLYNISVLSQRSSASVKSAKTQEENLNVQRNISLDATSLHHGADISSLYGNAAVINRRNADEQLVIPAGTYTIFFSDEVDINDITVQLEPAIDFLPQVSRNGVSVSDPSDLNYEDRISVRLVPVIPGTTEIIPDDALPEGMSWEVKYLIDGNEIASSKTNELTDITLDEGYNTVRGEITIPGFVPYKREFGFEIVNEVIEIEYNLGLIVEEPDVYVPSDSTPDGFIIQGVNYDRYSVCYKKIDLNSSNTVKFVITNDGIPLSSEQINDLDLSLSINGVDYTEPDSNDLFGWLGSKLMGCKLVQNEDGSYSIIPDKPNFFLISPLIKAGVYTVSVELIDKENIDKNSDSIGARGSFRLVPNKKETIIPFIPLVIVLLFIYLGYILFVKKKFNRQRVVCERWVIKSNGGGYLDPDSVKSKRLTNKGLLLPAPACRLKWNGFVFVADSDNQVYITSKSIAKKANYFGARTGNPESTLASITKSLNKTKDKDGRCTVDDMYLGKGKTIYFCNNTSGEEVWRLLIK